MEKSKGFFLLNLCAVSTFDDPGLCTGFLLGGSECWPCCRLCEAPGLGGLPVPARSAAGLAAAPLLGRRRGRHLRSHFWHGSRASPCPGPVPTLRRACRPVGSNALISWCTKDNSEYSLVAATAASVSMSISRPHCALRLKSALPANNAFIQADNVTKLLVNV